MTRFLFICIFFALILYQVLAVEECYVCLETCKEPLQIQNCKNDGFGDAVDVKCYAIEVISGGKTLQERGCLPSDVAEDECTKANQISGTTCRVCGTDLCNGNNDNNGDNDNNGNNGNGRSSGVASILSFLLLIIVSCL